MMLLLLLLVFLLLLPSLCFPFFFDLDCVEMIRVCARAEIHGLDSGLILEAHLAMCGPRP